MDIWEAAAAFEEACVLLAMEEPDIPEPPPEPRPYADPLEDDLLDFRLESEDAVETLPFELPAGASFFPFLLLLPLFFLGRMDED